MGNLCYLADFLFENFLHLFYYSAYATVKESCKMTKRAKVYDILGEAVMFKDGKNISSW